MQKSLINDLYTEFNLPLNEDALSKYQHYLTHLETGISEAKQDPNPVKAWNIVLTNFLRLVLFDALEAYGVEQQDLNFEYIVCGSLAKEQATPYSDIDSFLIWEDPAGDPKKIAAIEKMKNALKGMNNLFQRIFLEKNMLGPDPTGINPLRFSGTVEELCDQQESGLFDQEVLATSIMAAKSLTPSHSLLAKLQARTQSTPSTVDDIYHCIINTYSGPREKNKVNVKSDFLRPLDFFITLLRREYGLDNADAQFLNTTDAIKELVAVNAISYEFGDLLTSIFNEATSLRSKWHVHHGREYDQICLDDLKENEHSTYMQIQQLIDKVAIVRGITQMRQQKKNEKGLQEIQKNPIELTSVKNIPYKTSQSCHNVETLQVDILPYVFSHPARSFLQAQQAQIIQNLSQVKTYDPMSASIFSELTGIPEHLSFLSDSFNQCFPTKLINNQLVFQLQDLNINQFKDNFKEWATIFINNAMSDLFDKSGSFHPWLVTMLNMLGHKNIDLNQESFKKYALSSYVHTLISSVIASNNIMLAIKETEQQAQIWASIHEILKENFNSIENEPLLIETKINLYETKFANMSSATPKGALFDLIETVGETITTLKEIKKDTKDKTVTNAIDSRISSYTQLAVDMNHVARMNAAESQVLKSHFYYNVYTHFNRDLHTLKNIVAHEHHNFISKIILKVKSIAISLFNLEKTQSKEAKIDDAVNVVNCKHQFFASCIEPKKTQEVTQQVTRQEASLKPYR